MLANGTMVEVFEDPLTMTVKEGNAKIIGHVLNFEPGVDQYVVNFVEDDPRSHVVRTIAEKPLCICTDPIHPDNLRCRVHGQKLAGVK